MALNFVFTGSVTKPPITIPTRIPKCSDNFCQQECRDISRQGAKCFCRKGYHLQADQVSCRGNCSRYCKEMTSNFVVITSLSPDKDKAFPSITID